MNEDIWCKAPGPDVIPHCFPVCFRDQVVLLSQEMDAGLQAWQLRQQEKLQEEKGSSRMLLNPKGLYYKTQDQVNKKQLLSPFPSLSLAFFSSTWMCLPCQKKALCSPSGQKDGYQEERAIKPLPGRVGSVPSPPAPFQFSRILLWSIYSLFYKPYWPSYEQ